MEDYLKQITELAINQSSVFKKVTNNVLRQKLVMNEISLFYGFILGLNPTALPAADIRYRTYVTTFFKEFKGDNIVLQAILTGQIKEA